MYFRSNKENTNKKIDKILFRKMAIDIFLFWQEEEEKGRFDLEHLARGTVFDENREMQDQRSVYDPWPREPSKFDQPRKHDGQAITRW